jgi:hypothetical protein
VVVLRHGITTGHPWTVQSPSLSSDVGLGNTALGGNGTLYVVDSDNLTDTGLVWSYNGSQWANITSSNPSRRYGSLAVSKNKTLIAGGYPQKQVMSGHTRTTVSLPATASISGLTSTPDGTVCAFGQTVSAENLIHVTRSGGIR